MRIGFFMGKGFSGLIAGKELTPPLGSKLMGTPGRLDQFFITFDWWGKF